MKILAVIMDISFVEYWWRTKGYRISKVKKFLVYDPNLVRVPRWYTGREK